MMYVKCFYVRFHILSIYFKSGQYIKIVFDNYVRMNGKRHNQFKPGYNHENFGLSRSDIEYTKDRRFLFEILQLSDC